MKVDIETNGFLAKLEALIQARAIDLLDDVLMVGELGRRDFEDGMLLGGLQLVWSSFAS